MNGRNYRQTTRRIIAVIWETLTLAGKWWIALFIGGLPLMIAFAHSDLPAIEKFLFIIAYMSTVEIAFLAGLLQHQNKTIESLKSDADER